MPGTAVMGVQQEWKGLSTQHSEHLSKGMNANPNYLGSFCLTFYNQFHGWDCNKCWTEINKQHSDKGVVISKVGENWVEGSGYGIPCGFVGSESKLVRVQAGWDENQFLKALNQNGGECHRVLVMKNRHCGLFKYKDNSSCLKACGVSLPLLWHVQDVSNNIDYPVGTCSK